MEIEGFEIREVPKPPPGIENILIQHDPADFKVSLVITFPKNVDFTKSMNDTNVFNILKDFAEKAFPPV